MATVLTFSACWNNSSKETDSILSEVGIQEAAFSKDPLELEDSFDPAEAEPGVRVDNSSVKVEDGKFVFVEEVSSGDLMIEGEKFRLVEGVELALKNKLATLSQLLSQEESDLSVPSSGSCEEGMCYLSTKKDGKMAIKFPEGYLVADVEFSETDRSSMTGDLTIYYNEPREEVGISKIVTPYKNGKIDGKMLTFYDSPEKGYQGLMGEDQWVNSESHGELLNWGEDGNLKMRFISSHNEMVKATFWKWHENGNLAEEIVRLPGDSEPYLRHCWNQDGQEIDCAE